jgi:hypothetical protein
MLDLTNASGTGLFDLLGRQFYAARVLDVARATTVPTEVLDAMRQFKLLAGVPMSYDTAMAGLPGSSLGWQTSGDSLYAGLRAAAQNLVIEFCKTDAGKATMSLSDALAYLIDQMETRAYYVEPNTIDVYENLSTGNVGDPHIMLSFRRGDGKVQELSISEVMDWKPSGTVASTTASINVVGKPKVSVTAYDWPQGSGASLSLSPVPVGSSLVANGGFDSAAIEDRPDSWLVTQGVISDTVRLTDVEEQSVVISGSPTGGYYILYYTNAIGIVRPTATLAYNASGGAVQSALRAVPGLESVTVATTGTSPNYTHVITFTGVAGNLTQLTSTNATTAGAITHATLVDGSSGAYNGRALELVSNWHQDGAIFYQPLNVTPDTVYFLSARLRTGTGASEEESSSCSSSQSSSCSCSCSSSSSSCSCSCSSSCSCSCSSSCSCSYSCSLSSSCSCSVSSSSSSSSSLSSSSSCSCSCSSLSSSSSSSSSSCSNSSSSSSSSSSSHSFSSSCSSESPADVSSSSSSSSWSSSSSATLHSIWFEIVEGIGGAVINDDAGYPNRMVVNADMLSGVAHIAKSFSFRVPSSVRQPVYLKIWWYQPPATGNRVFVDDVIVTTGTELYPGGPFAAIAAGTTPINPDDSWKITVVNNRAGEMQTYFDRFFDASAQRLLLPSSGTYMLVDGLIA